MLNVIKRSNITKQLIAGFVAGLFALAILFSVQSANANVTDDVVVEDADVVVQIGNSTSSDKAKSIAKVKVIGNYRTVSEAKVKQAQQQNRCKTISGQQAIDMGVMTQGYNGSGVGFAPENRTTTMCDTNNDGKYDTRAECGNALKVTQQPRPQEAKATVWVNNFSNFKAKITATVKVKATAQCKTDYATASAYARATATSKAYVQVKTLTGANGKIKASEVAKIKAKATASASAQAKAKAKAKVKATTSCKSAIVIVPTKPQKPPVPPKPPTTPTTPEEEAGTVDNVKVSDEAAGVTPTSLPETGPGAVVATFAGVSSLSTLAYRIFTRRFGVDQ